MAQYNLTTPAEITKAANEAKTRAGMEPSQGGYNAAWLHGYAAALADVARQMPKGDTFREHDVIVTGEKHHLLELVEMLRRADVDGTWGDLVYKIEYEFDVDGIRSADEED